MGKIDVMTSNSALVTCSASRGGSNCSIIKSNQDRCAEILECKQQIEYWKAKLETLEMEQEENIKLARLRLDACSTWRCLSRKERSEKRFILAALESEEIPPVLEEFPNSSFPQNIRFDRDILLARVARPDFARKHRDDRFFVPPRLRGDKHVVLSIIPKHPQVIECMSCELRDDDEIFNAVVALPSLPPHFLQHFSERIRSDEKKMSALFSHREGLPSLAFCCQTLRNKKEFFLQAMDAGNHHEEPHVLRFASHRLRGDFDVVMNAVKHSGMNLKHASYELRRDMDIVAAATAQHAGAFRYCLPGPVKQQLLDDRQFVLRIVHAMPNNIIKACVERFQDDEEILLRALSSGLEWNSLSESRQNDQSFIMKAIQRNPQLYMDLPEGKRENADIAFFVVQCDEAADDVILEATEKCPSLLSNRNAMLSICKNWWTDVLQETLQFSPLEIRADKEIMMEAVRNDSIAFEYCSEELQLDRDIVTAAIENSPNVLFLVGDAFQCNNPDIVILAISKTDRGSLWTVYDDIYEELWNNRDVAMAWLAKGGDWLPDDFPEEFCQDRELLLTVAKHNWDEFDYAADELKHDKDFMLQALSLDGRIIRDIPDLLRHDFDLALAAFGNDRRAIQFYSGGEDFEFMVSFTNDVRTKLDEYNIFSNVVVSTILGPKPRPGDECQLSLLNQGPETVRMYQNRIASFLGLPEHDELHQLKSASKNLLAWGF